MEGWKEAHRREVGLLPAALPQPLHRRRVRAAEAGGLLDGRVAAAQHDRQRLGLAHVELGRRRHVRPEDQRVLCVRREAARRGGART